MKKKGSIIICRCEDVTEEEILTAIRKGFRTLEEIKRITRCGMGHCQGRTCRRLISQLLVRETSQKIEKILIPTTRPPLKPITLEILGKQDIVDSS
ncbi:MAG: (2Fe-2S)-binding protein [Candidatus Edwardsbacteria bacterium]